MIERIINNKFVKIGIVVLALLMFMFYLFSSNGESVIKFADNCFHVDTSTGNISAPSGTVMDCVVITQTRKNDQPLRFEYKYTTLHFCGNLLVGMDPESEWVEVTLVGPE